MTDSKDPKTSRREIRSFVLREGRITPGQSNALKNQWSTFGLNVDGDFEGSTNTDLLSEQTFSTPQPITFEIGFGMGDSLFEMATLQPDVNFIGIEVHSPGVGHLLQRVAEAELKNLKVFRADSNDVLEKSVPDAFLDKVQIFFPDPWHKKKHHKRRLISVEFVRLIARKLKAGGILHIATDWEPYAEVISEVIAEAVPDWKVVPAPQRPETKYERRGLRLDHKVTDLAFTKV